MIAAPFAPIVPVVDGTALEPAGRERVLSRLLHEEARRPFDLGRGPLLRVGLVRIAPEDHGVWLSTHHIVSDGWSLGVFFRELSVLYESFAAGRPSPLPELAVQYADFAAWQRRYLSEEILASELDYWRETLSGAPALPELPTDRPRPAVQGLRGATFELRLPAALKASLEELGRQRPDRRGLGGSWSTIATSTTPPPCAACSDSGSACWRPRWPSPTGASTSCRS